MVSEPEFRFPGAHLLSCYRPHPKDDGRLCFHFVHTWGGTPSSWWRGGSTPSSWRGRGTPSSWGGYPSSWQGEVLHPADRGGTASSWMGYPPVSWMGYPPVSWMGYPPPGGTPPPPPEQHNVYLLRDGRYASCVHAGGLSCLFFFLLVFFLDKYFLKYHIVVNFAI